MAPAEQISNPHRQLNQSVCPVPQRLLIGATAWAGGMKKTNNRTLADSKNAEHGTHGRHTEGSGWFCRPSLLEAVSENLLWRGRTGLALPPAPSKALPRTVGLAIAS